MKLHIEYVYGRNVFSIEQNRLSYGGVTLEDEIKLENTAKIFIQVGYLSFDMSNIDELDFVKL